MTVAVSAQRPLLRQPTEQIFLVSQQIWVHAHDQLSMVRKSAAEDRVDSCGRGWINHQSGGEYQAGDDTVCNRASSAGVDMTQIAALWRTVASSVKWSPQTPPLLWIRGSSCL